MMAAPHLVYFADPMCSWCWGFSPVISAIGERFGAALPIRLVLGGLRPWTTKPMDGNARASTRSHWEHVHEASGQTFDFAFFDRASFVYDTEPACRAVVVMRRRGMADALAGLHRIHTAFYAENRDVTDAVTLTSIAAQLGFDPVEFRAEFDADSARDETRADFALAQEVGVGGFPTVLAGDDPGHYALVTQGFQPAERILPALETWLANGPRHT
jgi:putative protein-disulfide isomerase